jgi:membrane protein
MARKPAAPSSVRLPAARDQPAAEPAKTYAPAAPHDASADNRSPAREYVTARAANRAGSLLGLRKVGMLSSALATAGLTMMRKRGRTGTGAALLATAAGLSLLRRAD